VIGRAAQVKYGKVLFSVYTSKDYVKQVIAGMQKGKNKLPCRCQITVGPVKSKIN
jgi:ribosomal protein L16/L10AE